MKRLSELEMRRRALLARCGEQREEIAWRLGQLGPRRWAQALASGAATSAFGALRSQRRHPLAWVVAGAAAAALRRRRPREALALLSRARGALTFAARAAEVLGVVSAMRRRKR